MPPLMPPRNGGCIRRSVDVTTSQPHAANLSHPSRDVNASIKSTHGVITPGVVLRSFKTIYLVLAAIAGTALVWGVGSVAVQRWELRRTVHSLTVKFPIGIELSQAQATIDRDYPRHTNYSPADCEKWSHRTTPAYNWRGGPCIFGLVNLNSRGYLIDARVEFKLIFGPNNRLAQFNSEPVYTFL
jgi:hypothetical protein